MHYIIIDKILRKVKSKTIQTIGKFKIVIVLIQTRSLFIEEKGQISFKRYPYILVFLQNIDPEHTPFTKDVDGE